jgi:hypothetical protein
VISRERRETRIAFFWTAPEQVQKNQCSAAAGIALTLSSYFSLIKAMMGAMGAGWALNPSAILSRLISGTCLEDIDWPPTGVLQKNIVKQFK